MDALSLATNGIIIPTGETTDITVTRVYQSIKIDINDQRPTVIIRPIKHKINITAQCYKE